MENDYIETSLMVDDYPEPNEESEGPLSEPEEPEILGRCAICKDYILEGQEIADDLSNTYGGECHENCFLEAEESRLS